MDQERPLIQPRQAPEANHGVPPSEPRYQSAQQPKPNPRPSTRGRWLLPALILLGLAVAAAAYWAFALRGEDTDAAQPAASAGEEAEVVVIDESEVDVVQTPSLTASATADGVSVENDGNVTMHDIKVVDGGNEVCAIDTLSPGDSSDCVGASASATISGLGPQDQPVEIAVG